jgi:hypothetical protein
MTGAGIEAPMAAGMPVARSQPAVKGPVTRKSSASDSRSWTRLAVAAGIVVALVIAGGAYFTREAPVPAAAVVEQEAPKRTTSKSKRMGSLKVTTEPSNAQVIVDGKPRGITPITVTDLTAGSHKIVLESTEGTVRRIVQITAGREAAISESIFPGSIAVYAPFEVQVFEGSRLVGTSDSEAMVLTPGTHDLLLINNQLGFREKRSVDVVPGQTTRINVTEAQGIVRVTAAAGAEVFIDGQRMGETPLGDLHVPIGTREIVVRHPTLGEQRFVTNVTASTPAEVVVDFSKR